MNDKLWASALILALSSNAVLLAILVFRPPNSPSAEDHRHPPPTTTMAPPRQLVDSRGTDDNPNSQHPVRQDLPDTGWLRLDARFQMKSGANLHKDPRKFQTSGDSDAFGNTEHRFNARDRGSVNRLSSTVDRISKFLGLKGSDDGANPNTATSHFQENDIFSEFGDDDSRLVKDLVRKLLSLQHEEHTPIMEVDSETNGARRFKRDASSTSSTTRTTTTAATSTTTTAAKASTASTKSKTAAKTTTTSAATSTTTTTETTTPTPQTTTSQTTAATSSKTSTTLSTTTTATSKTSENTATAAQTTTAATSNSSNSSTTTPSTTTTSTPDSTIFVPDGPPWGTETPSKINYIFAAPEKYGMEPVFSAFTQKSIDRMSRSIAETVVPALIQFEAIVFRQLDGLHSALVHQELRLGKMEKTISALEERITSRGELQSDAEDNKTGLKEIPDMIAHGFQLFGNDSGLVEVIGEGSGNVDDWTLPEVTTPTTTTTTTPEPTTTTTTTTTTTPTTTTPTTTTPTTTAISMEMIIVEQMKEDLYNLSYRLSGLGQRVEEFRNYRIMSEAEIMRTRSEVIKMDDKVTELERRHRNMKVRTTMQNYKLTELDMYMGRTELTMQATMDTFQRMTKKFDNFKDKMTDFADDLHKISSSYKTQQQISDELRTADAHKAHDIQDIRKTIMTLQSQFNDIYRLVDDGAMGVRNDMLASMERMCVINELIC